MLDETTSKLIFEEPPIVFQPTFAKLVGLNNSIIIQQLHYWLRTSPHIIEGRPWIYNTYDDWHRQFVFWSVRTIRTHIRELEKLNIIVPGNHNKVGFDRTKWYTLDYDRLNQFCTEQIEKRRQSEASDDKEDPATPSGEGCHMEEEKPAEPSGESCRMEAADPAAPIPETISKTNSETTSRDTTPSNAEAHVLIWAKCYEAMQLKISEAHFATWIRPIVPVQYDRDSKVLTVRAKDEFSKQWIRDNYTGMICEVLKEKAGGKDIGFRIIGPATEGADSDVEF